VIQPTGDKIIARRLPTRRRIGSLFAPDSAVRLSQEYVVEAAGPGEYDAKGRLQPLDVKPGDHVIVTHLNAKAIEIDGEEKWVCREKDVIGVIIP